MFVDPYLATITNFAGNFAPLNWAFCNGALLSIADNQALFSLIGTTYGGDGMNTFALPDLRGRYAIHAGQGPGLPYYSLGEMAGSENTTLLSVNLPAHNHGVIQVTGGPGAQTESGNVASPAGAVAASVNTRYNGTSDGDMMSTVTIATSGISGANAPVSNIAPYLAMNYIICVEGIYPSRN
ncbi:MAG: phage tail protein [Fluviicola sp.]|nr:phage tail protein [Fluviicola sp.]